MAGKMLANQSCSATQRVHPGRWPYLGEAERLRSLISAAGGGTEGAQQPMQAIGLLDLWL